MRIILFICFFLGFFELVFPQSSIFADEMITSPQNLSLEQSRDQLLKIYVNANKGKTFFYDCRFDSKGEIYENSCAVTEISQKEVLEAAHIQGYINEESNNVQNGICLRVDIHKLFDNGLISIDKDYKVVVSSMLKSTEYEKINGKKIKLPKNKTHHPSSNALDNHNRLVFRK